MTREELIEIGVNPDNMVYPNGEMNIIVHCFGCDDDEIKNNELTVYPDIYQPRRNRVYSCGCTGEGIDLSDENARNEYLIHLKDSAERLKIMAYKMSLQIKELEEKGYFTTSLYYPE